MLLNGYFIFSSLLKERIIFLEDEIEHGPANSIIAQMLFLESLAPEEDINLYINSSVKDGKWDVNREIATDFNCDLSPIERFSFCTAGFVWPESPKMERLLQISGHSMVFRPLRMFSA